MQRWSGRTRRRSSGSSRRPSAGSSIRITPGGYGLFAAEETGIGGGIGSTPDGSPGHVTFYVEVPDIDRALETIERLGGRTLMPKTSPAPGTTIALFADPEGHVLG